MPRTQYQIDLIEVWKPILNAPRYEVSSFGRVKKDNRIKPPSKGTAYTSISINGANNLLHILVMETFVGVRPKKSKIIVNHKDRNIKNNRLDNLEYLTSKGNRLHILLEKLDDLNPYGKPYATKLSKQYKYEKRKALRLINSS